MVQKQVAFEQTEPTKVVSTLSDISPKWAKRLEERDGKLPKPMSLTWIRWYFELKRASKCIVGEAHNYSSSYIHNCGECDEIGWKFMFYFSLHMDSKLKENQQRFITHWNLDHLKEM